MSPLKMGTARIKGASSDELVTRSTALAAAVDHGGEQLDPAKASAAKDVTEKVRARLGLTGDHTVIALAGATGSGKSSLFNALTGAQVATIGARRPTTSRPSASVWGNENATELLDWLDVAVRHSVPGDPGNLDGLVLLDLPDFDSREVANREEAERVLQLVDVFIWVTDPQKYADARLHHDYVSVLATHEAVTMVVLNQVDRLTPDQTVQCLEDLKRLLAADGLPRAIVASTSARTGAGLDELRQRLANAVAGQNAARTRLVADVASAAARLSTSVGAADREVSAASERALCEALSRAAGVPSVVAAVDRDYRHEAISNTGWPFTRWVRALRPAPLRRLRLDGAGTGVTDADVRAALGRSSLPPPTPAARSAVELAVRSLADDASTGLPLAWSDAVHDAASPQGNQLSDAVDQAIIGTPLRDTAPKWWRVVSGLHLVFAVTAIAGLLWLVGLSVMGFLHLPEIQTPTLGWFPLPFILLVGGLLAGIMLALLSRWFAGIGARRRAARAQGRLMTAIDAVAAREIVGPVSEVLARHSQTRHELARAAGNL